MNEQREKEELGRRVKKKDKRKERRKRSEVERE